jgi:multiubiquitin
MSNEQTQSQGEHEKKQVTIIVNGRPFPVAKEEISFDAVVALANLVSGPNIVYTVTYDRGHGDKPQGSLVEGKSVKVKDGMIFNVTATDKS